MALNTSELIQEFSQANMDAIVRAYPLGNLEYRNVFPLEFNPTLEYANLEGMHGAKLMADVVAIGSKAPRKGRDFVESIKGDIPKIEIARDMTEKDFLVIDQLRHAVSLNPESKGVKNQLIEKIYGDIPFCIDGVNSRLEWMAKQLVSTGKFITDATNNAGGVAKLTIDFGIKNQNAAKNWHTAVDADPVKEIDELQEIAIQKGYSYSTMTTDRATINKILNNKNVKAFVVGVPINETTVLPNITIEQLNAELSARGLPTFVVWNTFVSAESKAGKVVNVNGWEEGNIHFSISPILGSTKYTITSEFRMNFADVITQSVKDDFILVKTFGHQDPISVSTKGTAFALPVLNNTKQSLILKTKV